MFGDLENAEKLSIPRVGLHQAGTSAQNKVKSEHGVAIAHLQEEGGSSYESYASVVGLMSVGGASTSSNSSSIATTP